MWYQTEDPTRLVDASKKQLVTAYDSWIKVRGRVTRGSNTHSTEVFLKAVVNHLDLSKHDIPKSLGLPHTRSGWSNWRNGRGKPLTKLRLDICRAIMALTGIDVTANGFLRDTPLNTTDMVILGPVTSKRIVTDSKKTHFEANVEWIDFRVSSPKEVTLDLAKENALHSSKNLRIGSVRYALKEASIYVKSDTAIKPLATYIQDETENEYGKASGLELSIDSDEYSSWRLQPPFPKPVLQARVENLRLFNTSSESIHDATVGISVSRADIEPNITLDQKDKISEREFQNTRQKLIEQVLRNRFPDPIDRDKFVLSHAKVMSE